MKTTTKIVAALAAAAALALAGAVSAQPGYGPGFGMGPGSGAGPGWGGMGPGMGPGWGGGTGSGWGHMGGWGGMGRGGFGMMGPSGFDMSATAAARLAALKSQLKITSAQEPAWKAYEVTVTQQAEAMQALRDQFRAQWQNAKPGEARPDTAAQQQAMLAQRQSNQQAQGKALKDLYAALTPEQVATMNGGWGPRGGFRR